MPTSLLISGCTAIAPPEQALEMRGPLVAEDVVRLDLREAPTSEEAGLVGDRRDLVLSRVGEALDVELQLPSGTLPLNAFRLNIGGPIGGPDPSYAGRVLISVRAGVTAAVLEQLGEQAGVLGLDPDEVQDWGQDEPFPDADGTYFFSTPATEPAIEVEVRAENADSWTLNYSFSFDRPPPDSVGTPS